MAKFYKKEIEGKPTQAMNGILSQIGENSIIYLISCIANGTNWEAFKNISEGGSDLLLREIKGSKRIRIEVKTRQTIFSTQIPIPNYVAFDLTVNEWKSCDFLIGYWWDETAFYIVPKDKLQPVKREKDGPVTIYRYIARRKNAGILKEDDHLNNWDLINKILK